MAVTRIECATVCLFVSELIDLCEVVNRENYRGKNTVAKNIWTLGVVK